MAIEPTEKSFVELAAEAAEVRDPVVMVNLLKFAGPDGAAHYQRYVAGVQPCLEAVGGSLVYAGDVAQTVVGEDDSIQWDALVVVRYPSRAAFLTMISSPEYAEVHHHRTAALETTELIATNPWMAEN